MNCLIINAGNTTIKLALFKKGQIQKKTFINTRELTSVHHLFSVLKDWGILEKKDEEGVQQVFIASVVPEKDAIFLHFSKGFLGITPIFISSELNTGISIDYGSNATLGADRLANAVAAFKIYRQNVLVVDIGTAINFDCVTRDGVFIGGAIAPGLWIAQKALSMNASKLPPIDLTDFSGEPLGKDTVSCIKSGLIFGFAGLIDRLSQEISSQLTYPTRIIATGGGASLLLPYSNTIEEYVPDLTIQGIFYIGLMNS
ncbi:Pantothenate kinase type III, CoaX-like protein [Dissulfuribacter thermophilus]|uniref:Type III pantothenate kinase n=1 Tax=Dissulfuribacter thermophilus TaxID=1156395 RepID=A0A1B9F593_9BACT|nr:type III pantothenate kinase [Dissulfuribacter thermophilus]OCC15043.1 Pantothenate kinase type III, CoaX-like protein [Dissulfuribacter thermophilus]